MALAKSGNASLGIASASLAALCWGGAMVMSKGALDNFYPMTLLIIQLIVSVTFLWCVVVCRKATAPSGRKLVGLSLLGLLEPCLTYVLVLIGLTHAGATEASLLQALESIMIVVLAMLLYKEIPSIKFVYLSVMVLTGLFIALDVRAGNINGDWYGGTLVSLGMFCAAGYVVLSSRVAKGQDIFYTLACQQTLALVVSIFMLPLEWVLYPDNKPLPDVSGEWGVWVLALASGIVQYAFAFSFYIFSLRYIRAGLAGMFLNLIPVVGVLGAVVFLGERLSPWQAGGAALTMLALVLIARNSSSETVAVDGVMK